MAHSCPDVLRSRAVTAALTICRGEDALGLLAAAVLRAGCLLATDPVAAVAELGAALLRQLDVELALAAVPAPGSCECLTWLRCARKTRCCTL